ncbi:NADH:flavin oxidoreductase [Marinilongibacter aquaticus]|uniref:oxidoreductase n=1 Tax=Marinilongibacter aquaticus TaxID=2975157 RepID=UPI0021BDE75C|nr:NADH:flavin oxidoreductase [Marinilongibacter aquaticus]UBM58959.1 NADH:flavin oxidoreductase [Marinilongibacter aquaticus]
MNTKSKPKFKRIAQLKTPEIFSEYLKELGISMPFHADIEDRSPFTESYTLKTGETIGNRFCILPMEGWDGSTDGRPSEHTKRRWKNFAISGAKLLFGCEAVAVRPDGRANPNQLMLNEETFADFEALYDMLMQEHENAFGQTDDFLVGLQLTHSGRFCKPFDKHKLEPKILYPHPILNDKFGLGEDYPLLSDEYIDELIQNYIQAAVLAQKAGFKFVDIKHCHGYLGHEFLSAMDREGKYGGSFENRTRFLKEIVQGIKEAAPGLGLAIRLSAFDWQPFKPSQEDGTGEPSTQNAYKHAFGGTSNGQGENLEDTKKFLRLVESLGIELVCLTAGSPYYNPHITRPALFPPSDGYLPPEDPLVGVARQIAAVAELKAEFPNLCLIGSAYSYLQEWLPNVGHAVLTEHKADFIGFGRMVLSYPDMPADIALGKSLTRNKICRTFSDCTTGPRNGMLSGCFPLDPYYKAMPEAQKVKELK